MKITDLITNIPHVGPAQAAKFARLKIKTVEDLFCFLPKNILDLSKPVSIAKIQARFGEKIVLFARVEKISIVKTPRKHIFIVTAKLYDDTGEIAVHWFNQPYLQNFFKAGQKYLLYGEFSFDFRTRRQVISNPEILPAAGLYPIYPLTQNLTGRQISRAIASAWEKGYRLEKILPNLDLNESLQKMHFPKNVAEFWTARNDFIMQELTIFILANLLQRKQNQAASTFKITNDRQLFNKFIKSLPFELTADQRKTIDDIMADFEKPYPMSRLIEGDVGSGKTVVALAAAVLAIKSGYRVAWLAPTQILASQHYDTAKRFLQHFELNIDLVTSQTKLAKLKSQSSNLKIKAKNSKVNTPDPKLPVPDLSIGTHALLQKDVTIENLALVIVDEQHRFGVEQREILSKKNTPHSLRPTPHKNTPHFLSLSATPIPRSLAHTVFGNLDLSIIKTKPVGRKPVKTFLIPQNKCTDSYKFIDDLIKQGQQVFVICPLIENAENEDDDRKSVIAEAEKLKKTCLGRRRIEILHGRMKGADKEKIMMRMRASEIDILVSTSVVEVGVDIPRATVMVIEGAQNFGLSQLHQFRGRVGRADLESFCFLFSNNLDSEKTVARLKAFVQCNDGFELAQMDLKLRGPGAILGTKQAGLAGLNPLWFEDTALLARAQKLAQKISADKIPTGLMKKITLKLETEHLE